MQLKTTTQTSEIKEEEVPIDAAFCYQKAVNYLLSKEVPSFNMGYDSSGRAMGILDAVKEWRLLGDALRED